MLNVGYKSVKQLLYGFAAVVLLAIMEQSIWLGRLRRTPACSKIFCPFAVLASSSVNQRVSDLTTYSSCSFKSKKRPVKDVMDAGKQSRNCDEMMMMALTMIRNISRLL